ncbi:helix-turn-helix domain-containing protein [Sporosarcina sp. ITBMC105]
MTERNQQQQTQLTPSKALPFEVEKGWTGVPNSIFTVYMKHPDINPTAIVVYGHLLRHYNDQYGYAFPSQVDMAISLGVSTRTIKSAISKLKKVELITPKYNMQFGNNHYFFNKPCETIEELLRKFPVIKKHLEKLDELAQKTIEEAEIDRERLAKARGKSAVGQ